MQYRTESDDTSLDRSPADAAEIFARAGIHIDAAGSEHPASPRARLARELRNAHLLPAARAAARLDELNAVGLEPRARLAAETADMWRTKS